MVIDSPDWTDQERLNFGVHCGVYRVEISHATRKIPAKYNTQTQLGVNVALNAGRDGEMAVFHLGAQ